MNTLIKNGVIVTASDTFKGDILIEEEIITKIGTELNISCDQIIDATDKYVIPGGVDVHTHLNLDIGIAVATDDFYTGTVAAACGGTTCIVDHLAFGPKGCNLHHQINTYHGYAKNKAVIDYSFHGVVQHVDDNMLNEMEELVNEGITSYKVYLTYDYKLTDLEIFRVLMKAKEIGSIITVHPENNDVIAYLREHYSNNGFTEPIYHAKSRPVECEGEAINKMINLSKVAGQAALYIVHLSCKLGLDYIKFAKSMGQKHIFAETCPQYLFLNEEKYNEKNNEGLKYIMSPPLREKFNQDALWYGIKNGDIQVVATDHCPFNFNIEKQMGKDNFTKCPNGSPGIEARVPLMFSEGVMKNRISINRFVDIVSTNPAKIFGLYPKKGTIAVGSDADIVIIDPKKKVKLSKSILHENVDYTPYEGMEVEGYPVLTLSRGKVIVINNKFVGEKGYGEFIKRKKFMRNIHI
ncbi:dihydropyrimidinase [Clostridium tetanomorphum]|uniref:Dihydropyrimidinase n=1 Tax=Clostridium tetanomorphum TaxID=1553 RepID=A0A923EDA3_CLOTT|nr:dihydropyrimidinase [Clostridium tetanomorphum]KAJ50795.1 phenylhydantoinase [Clostridium tetanomorphum DSM 665]MBC2399934.1 dihydropyrimidinase [Clostridium tetanomorphum]MBP1866446.1 dihydropyrimidinase [Clostridium tetanomorphum]NRS86667.1 dihydropyrimidinase [Clostridium tetanomorphum]NRZ95329.1 dihydropyrimidinase [Clostridium tetanomorphum]